MTKTVSQHSFKTAILSPDTPVPEGLVNANGEPAGKRFSVYRNNVAVSLTEALILAFPVVHKLVGNHNFRILAGQFLRAHPPSSPLLTQYGAEFPTFVSGFDLLREYGYLPDVARLELAIRRSYHAADVTPVSPEMLQTLAPEKLMASHLQLAPASCLIRSPWPVFQIWQFNMHDGPKPEMRAEDVLVVRPEFDPQPVVLPSGGGVFFQALQDGQNFGDALSAAGTEDENFDLGATLAAMLSGGAICGITES